MKKTFLKPAIIIAIAACFQSFTLAKPPVAVERINKGKAEVVYKAIEDDLLVFQLQISNVNGEKAFLTIKNEAGDDIYTNIYRQQQVSQMIKIPSSEQKELHFSINGRALGYSKVFMVNTHYVPTIEVKESK